MIGLVLDTSSEKPVIGLLKGKDRDTFIGDKPKHNASLLPSIDALLEKNNLQIKDIEYFGAVIGPGSFTGIRVGVASINAFCFALGKKAVAITAFELAKYGVSGDILSLVDARHNNYYTALYANNTIKYAFLSIAEIESMPYKTVVRKATDPNVLLDIFISKIKQGELTAPLRPFYLKPSSAEVGL